MSGGARSPEELEMLFEDALVVGDVDALREIFEAGRDRRHRHGGRAPRP